MKYPFLIVTVALFSGPLTAEAGAQQRPSTPTAAQYAAARAASKDITNPRDNYRKFEQRYSVERLFRDPAAFTQTYGTSLSVANCVVGVSGERAGSLIGGPNTGDPGYVNLNRAMTGRYRGCVRDGDLRYLSRRLLNSAIAERLLTREDHASGIDRATQIDAISAAAFHGDITKQPTLSAITRCTVVYSPGIARKVLNTETGSADENSALEELYSRTPECGMARPPADIPSAVQRAAVAEGLYAWTEGRR